VAKCDSEAARWAIEDAHHAASCALTVSRRRSGGDRLTKIRLEPMYLRDTPSRRRQQRPFVSKNGRRRFMSTRPGYAGTRSGSNSAI
jgi:hypothetical protein